MKKYKALENVADAISQSVETLRSWEKGYSFDDDCMMALRVAQMAGELEEELDTRPINDLIEEYGTEYFRHSSDVEYAKIQLRELRAAPLKAIREGLRKARGMKSGS